MMKSVLNCFQLLLCVLSCYSRKEEKTHQNKIETVTLTFVGDINLGGPTRFFERQGLYGYSEPFKHVAKILRDSDLTIGNYESVMTKPGLPLDRLPKIDIHICSETDTVTGLKYAGFDIMTIANNHIHDFGEAATNLTLETLQNAGMDVIGYTSGAWDSPQKPLVKHIKGVKIAFLAYCFAPTNFNCTNQRKSVQSGAAAFTNEILRRDVEHLKKLNVDIIIVYIHWGKEYTNTPLEYQREIARFMSSLGVNIIIGSHPHVLQTHEYINKTLVIYSLGNFIFPRRNFNIQFCDKVLTGSKPMKIGATEEVQENYITTSLTEHDPTQNSLILRIVLNRHGVVRAKYLPCDIRIDAKTKCLQPTPSQKNWINVSSTSP